MQDRIKNKKATSSTISSIILIILVISTVSFIGYTLLKTIPTDTVLQTSPTRCVELQTHNLLKIENACYNTESHEIEITIQRQILAEEKIEALLFKIHSASEESSWQCSSECSNCEILEPGTVKKYYFANDETQIPETIELYSDGCKIAEQKIEAC
jgi:hypothetical protein